jgi:hypothetical protein
MHKHTPSKSKKNVKRKYLHNFLAAAVDAIARERMQKKAHPWHRRKANTQINGHCDTQTKN